MIPQSRTGWIQFVRVLAWILFVVIVLVFVIFGIASGPLILLFVPIGVVLGFAAVAGIFLKLDLLEDYHSMRLSLESIERSLRTENSGGPSGEQAMEDDWEEEDGYGEEMVCINGQPMKLKVKEKGL